MPSTHTAFLRAGHGPRRAPRPLTPAQVAAHIVASIRVRQREGQAWCIAEYTHRETVVVLVQEALGKAGHPGTDIEEHRIWLDHIN